MVLRAGAFRIILVSLAVLSGSSQIFFWQATTEKPAFVPLPESPKIELAHTTIRELVTLPGIGFKLAERIMAVPERAGALSVADLKRVKGLGPKKIRRLYPYLYPFISGSRTLPLKNDRGSGKR